jgi:hypothetical protein
LPGSEGVGEGKTHDAIEDKIQSKEYLRMVSPRPDYKNHPLQPSGAGFRTQEPR